MIALAFIAGIIVGAVMLAAALFLIAWAVALAEASEETAADDAWLARVAAGALNSHSTDISREAQRDHVQP